MCLGKGKMNEAEMFKLAQNFDEDAKIADFYDNYQDVTQFDVQKTAKTTSNKDKNALKNDKTIKKQQKKQIEQFKQKYFDFYDDIKIPSHKVTDW